MSSYYFCSGVLEIPSEMKDVGLFLHRSVQIFHPEEALHYHFPAGLTLTAQKCRNAEDLFRLWLDDLLYPWSTCHSRFQSLRPVLHFRDLFARHDIGLINEPCWTFVLTLIYWNISSVLICWQSSAKELLIRKTYWGKNIEMKIAPEPNNKFLNLLPEFTTSL